MTPIAVVMATYNGSRYIKEQLASIIDQTLLPTEIVVGDDGSTDDTLAIIEDFSQTCSVPVCVHRNERRLGFADNFLHAVSLSTARFVAFADQDDVWRPTKLQACHNMMEQTGAVLCSHTMLRVDEERRAIGVSTQEIFATGVHPPLSLHPWGIFSGLSVMFDRKVLDIIPASWRGCDNNLFDQPLAHDRWVYFLAGHFGSMAVIKEPLVEYRQHSNNTIGSAHKSLVHRVQAKIEEGAPRIAKLAELAEFRVQMLRAARTDAKADQFDAAIARWMTIAANWRKRHDLYVGSSLPDRMAMLLDNAKQGRYATTLGSGLGHRGLLEDATLGVFGKTFSIW